MCDVFVLSFRVFFFFRFFQERKTKSAFLELRERERERERKVARRGDRRGREREEERFNSIFFFFFFFSVVLFSVGFKRTNRQRREKGKGELEKQKQTLLPDIVVIRRRQKETRKQTATTSRARGGTTKNGEKQQERFSLPESGGEPAKDERIAKVEILLPVVREAVQRPKRIQAALFLGESPEASGGVRAKQRPVHTRVFGTVFVEFSGHDGGVTQKYED
jgi:hypothetical protein